MNNPETKTLITLPKLTKEQEQIFQMDIFFQLCFVDKNMIEQTAGLIDNKIIDVKFNTKYHGRCDIIRIKYNIETNLVENLYTQIKSNCKNFHDISQQETINIISNL